MATTSKKTPKKSQAKPRAKSASPSVAKLKNTIAAQAREIREGAEQQVATSEILRMIAKAPGDLQSVLDTLLANAVKLSGATQGHIRQFDGEFLTYVSHFNESPEVVATLNQLPQRPRPESISTRALTEKHPVHILDAQAEPNFRGPAAQAHARTMLVAPLLREDVGIGTITIWRDFVEPFTDRQIELVKTFADQGVIAIENVRLFNELEARNRDLSEALEQQTATAEILGVIASSPTDLNPVLEAITERAARVCGAEDAVMRLVEGHVMRLAAHYGSVPDVAVERPIDRQSPPGRAVLERDIVHIENIQLVAASEFPGVVDTARRTDTGTVLAVPLMREGVALGVIHFRPIEVRPFSEKQIALLKSFADQAVIAIENVRLFQELQVRNRDLTEALEQQTATGEVLRVIASSPTELQPVLDTLIANAVKLAGAKQGHIRQHDGEYFRAVAHYGESPELVDTLRTNPIRPAPDTQLGREFLTRTPLHILDARLDPDRQNLAARTGARTLLVVPLLREDSSIGGITIWRDVVDPFSDRQIELVKTFADQAVIAIENVRLFQELTESLDQQTATSEILGVIASSPTDIQPVLDTVAANAARLCEANDAQIYRVEGALIRKVAIHGDVPSHLPLGETRPLTRGSVSGRAVLDREMVHFHDMWEARQEDFPDVHYPTNERLGLRTFLSIPLLREGVAIGVITIRRREVQPFTEKQIALLKTFADQAVIAIENVRLFQELQVRNRDLTEALEQQTATGEVLRVIASSPTDIQPVLDTVAANAACLCDATNAQIFRADGDVLRLAANFGDLPARTEILLGSGTVGSRAITERRTVHVHDLDQSAEEFPESQGAGYRTRLATPLLREGVVLGVIGIRRLEVRPFTDSQIKLLETFAAQAVIAIENVRLFQELKESLEQQTATSEILGVIASSPTDIQPVLDAVIANAVKLSGATKGHVRRLENGFLHVVAHCNETPEQIEYLSANPIPVSRSVSILENRVVHRHDLQERNQMLGIDSFLGARTQLGVPLQREGIAIGNIMIWRDVVEPFTDRQIDLVKTFADQAVIAIENVRLFNELQQRNRDLTEALEQQTATSEILGVIASSPTDLTPVLETVARNAARLCEAKSAQVYRTDGDLLRLAANYGELHAGETRPIGRGTVSGRAVVDRKTIHTDERIQYAVEFPDSKSASGETRLSTPLLREGVAIGVIGIRRTELRPFTESQIKLIETFAKQAVIAIENVRLFNELKESLEQQTATSEILGVIASSPTDIQPVLDTVAQNALRVCGAEDALVWRLDGSTLRLVANCGSLPARPIGSERQVDHGSITGRAVIERQTVHVQDVAGAAAEFPSMRGLIGAGTALATPLLREGVPIGVIHIRRMEIGPFSDKQISLLKTFADQAVIAIENVRLFKELGERNAELREALEHQTATAEVLGIISRSPTDVQPVLDAIVESAAKVCGIDDVVLRLIEGDAMVARAHFGPLAIPTTRAAITMDEPRFSWMREHGTLHIPDVREQQDFPGLGSVISFRTFLAVPLKQQGQFIGTLNARRTEVRPFTPVQIKLMETFADQGVIAIENVRLFKELQERNRDLTEALEQQTATSEILRVDRQLADGYAAGAGHSYRQCRETMRAQKKRPRVAG